MLNNAMDAASSMSHYARGVALFRLCRPEQWYKNVIAFVPLFFVGSIADTGAWKASILAFIGLCLLSSAGYALNDIWDASLDRKNPEKRSRPVASGAVRPMTAAILSLVLVAAGLATLSFSTGALVAGSILIGMMAIYTMLLKTEPILDVIALGTNFVLRAAVGAFAIGVTISPWLILCAFFLAMELGVGKRLAESRLQEGKESRPALGGYTPHGSFLLLGISATMLMMSYSLYSFVHGPHSLMFTLPFAFYGVIRHAWLADSGSPLARHPHKMVLDWRMALTAVTWSILTLVLLYL